MRFTLRRGVLSLFAIVCLAGPSHGDDRATTQPNIVLCMADDHGWGDTGYNGHPFLKTPHLDRMARDGMKFNRWYAAAPVCSPTRGSCLTGRHPHRYGVYFANTGSLKDEEICLAELLKERGYTTGHFGKWHLGTLTTTVKDANRGGPGSEAIYAPPWDNGFDVCFSTESKVPTYDPLRNPPAVAREAKRGVPTGGFFGTHYWTGPGESVPDEELRGDDSKLIMDRVIPFVSDAAGKDQPFLAVVWFHAPHTPVVADEEKRSLYPDHPHGLYGQHYHGCITAMDEQIGRLRATLEDLGVADDTMLWYCADNGPESPTGKGAGSAGHFRGRKRSLYEGGVRVPGLLVWPNRVAAGQTTDIPCVTSDYLPTICDVLDIELPERPYDGISLLPLLDGQMTERGQPIGFQSRSQRSLVSDRYKLYTANDGQTWELYDLIQDPGETENLADSHPQRVEEMQAALAAWMESCDASDRGEDYRR
ncbi:Arylsulfatase precursor [Maioricimonas rarisocia]|uniref:Arylsulfatase n=1 Tax=Maioricimonas rarisocia TaxID=2528026 RepID=A0A517Z6A1_9PLAN|nr:sulfatase-like hydrolase/transferase [Maioricimonas rarisocia]QDU38007.1 Arylsulfatase precursor [Maioricimonas rarisocia]